MRSAIFFAALPLLAAAWNDHVLFARETTGNATSCAESDKVCGEFCIPSSYTCCPDLEGGCSANDVCQKGSNDEYGCCPEGRTCTGDGGSEFIDSPSSTTGSSAAAATKSGESSSGADSVALNNAMLVAAAAAGLFISL